MFDSCSKKANYLPALHFRGGERIVISQKGNQMLKEFKEFAIKGNMIDMAVGIVIGAAFGAIIGSLVDDVFMPVVGLLLGGIDFSNWFILLGDAGGATIPTVDAAKEAGIATINIGLFINAIIKFIIIAFALFILVKGINSMKRKEEEKPAAPKTPPPEEVLLKEIRDLLKK